MTENLFSISGLVEVGKVWHRLLAFSHPKFECDTAPVVLDIGSDINSNISTYVTNYIITYKGEEQYL